MQQENTRVHAMGTATDSPTASKNQPTPGLWTVQMIEGGDFADNEQQHFANVRLMAAAPELLEFARRQLAETSCVCRLNAAFGTAVRCTHCDAKAAIAKAEGR